jgi:hypothetical protein
MREEQSKTVQTVVLSAYIVNIYKGREGERKIH